MHTERVYGTDSEPEWLGSSPRQRLVGLRGVWVVAARCCAGTRERSFLHVQAQTRTNRQGAGFIQSTGEGGPQRPAQGASEFETGAGACTARPSGATLATIMTSTGWQPHTVRGFFAAVVRKKLALRLESDKTDGERVYRIVAVKTSADSADQPSA